MRKFIYRTLTALEPVKKVLEEAGCGVADKRRTINTSGIPEILGAVAGMAAGLGVGVAAVSAAGTVSGLGAAGITSGLASLGLGGGMVAGIFVAAAPMALLGIGGYAALHMRNKHKLQETKDVLLKDALLKQDAIVREMQTKVDLTEGRTQYLNALNILLREIIANLERDLGIKNDSIALQDQRG